MKLVVAAVLLSVGVIGSSGGAIAATKSLVAPTEINEAVVSEPILNEKLESVPQLPEEATPNVTIKQTVEIQPPLSPSPNLTFNQAPKVVIQTPVQQKLSEPGSESVVLESRSSGCSASDRRLGSVQANLCDLPLKPETSATYPEQLSRQPNGIAGDPSQSYGSYQFSGIRATVRPLFKPAPTWTKVALPFNLSISLPLSLARNISPNLDQNSGQNLTSDRQMTFPLSIPAIISSSFGYRIHPISGEERFHQGTDIAASEGTPVLAAYSGKVEISGWLGGLGLAIIISHEGDRETRYGHLSELLVQPGQWVEQGTAIGLVGSTGMSTGPHLHFELWQKQLDQWVATDPSPYLNVALAQLNRFLAQQSKLDPA